MAAAGLVRAFPGAGAPACRHPPVPEPGPPPARTGARPRPGRMAQFRCPAGRCPGRRGRYCRRRGCPARQWQADLRALSTRLADTCRKPWFPFSPPSARAMAAALDALAARLQVGEPAPTTWRRPLRRRRAPGRLDPSQQQPARRGRAGPGYCRQLPGVRQRSGGRGDQVGAESGLRYLHCGQCHTAWHHVRASCVACGEAKDCPTAPWKAMPKAARAETCDAAGATSSFSWGTSGRASTAWPTTWPPWPSTSWWARRATSAWASIPSC